MKNEKIIAGVFATVLGGMAFKVFSTIIDDRKEEIIEEVKIEDER